MHSNRPFLQVACAARCGCETGTACAPCISRQEGRNHGTHPHHRRTALSVRGRRLLLEQETRVIVGLERTRGPVSPFHDLRQRCGGTLPAERAPYLPSAGPAPAADGRPGANTDLRVVSLPRFVRLVSLCVLGLIGLLSLGVGGVALVQGYVFRPSTVGTRELTGASRHEETSSSRANARRGSSASARGTDGDSSAEVLGNGVRPQRWAAESGTAPGRPGSSSENQSETQEAAYEQTATRP